MSLLDRIKQVKLRKTETKVLTPDGRELIESRDHKGVFRSTQVSVKPWGFVADVKPDLQAAEILPFLFLSSQDVAQDLPLLKSLGISHVLNVASHVDNHFDDVLVYKRIEIFDLPTADIRKHFGECFFFIDEALSAKGKVLVHCNAGVSRSATIVIAYLMQKQNISLPEAIDRVRSIRSSVRPNEGFMKQLLEFERDLQTNSQTVACSNQENVNCKL